MIYPWQYAEWQALFGAHKAGQLPHALLFTGVLGTGKAHFADSFSQLLLCQEATLFPCGTCHMCRLVKGRAHPNVLWIEPEKAGQAIKVDQIREVSEFINQSALQGAYRVVIIHPADQMNLNAANALLKTLEEPSQGSLLILITDQNGRLPQTVLSRCQRVRFPPPKQTEAVGWLKDQLEDKSISPELLLTIANNGPVRALQLVKENHLSLRQELFTILSQPISDPLKSAAKLAEGDVLQIIDFSLSWIADLLRLQLSGDVQGITNKDYERQLIALKQSRSIKKNLQWMESLQQSRGLIAGGLNLNKQLVIETLLIQWKAA